MKRASGAESEMLSAADSGPGAISAAESGSGAGSETLSASGAGVISASATVETTNRKAFLEGVRDGLPIGMGYLAVAFSLGITARNAGFTALQGFVMSILVTASAGEYAGITVVASDGAYVQMVLAILVANARYLLMSSALSQRLSPKTSVIHRFLIAFGVTDEIFAISVARPGYLKPFYSYGAMLTAIPLWALGTALGVIAGNLLPVRIVSAFSVALYGMFLAVIFPAAKKDRVVAGLIAVCFAASYACARLPGISTLSSGTRTILLTVLLGGLAAVLFPRKPEEETEVQAKSDGRTEAESRDKTGSGAEAEVQAESDSRTEAESDSRTEAEGVDKTGSGTEAEVKTEMRRKSETQNREEEKMFTEESREKQ